MVSYKVAMGSDGSIMPFNIYNTFFPSEEVNKLAATKDAKIKLKAYNHTKTYLGRCKIK